MSRKSIDFNLVRAMEVFVAVADMQQVTKAAQMLGVTQSAASQNLRALEMAFGITLFDRKSRPISLTRSGIALYNRAQKLLTDVDEIRTQLRDIEDVPVPMLRVGLLGSLSWMCSTTVVGMLRDELQIPDVQIRSDYSPNLTDLFNNRTIDMMVTADPIFEVAGLEWHPILKEPFFVVLPADYTDEVTDLEALAREIPYIRFSTHTPVGQSIEQQLRRVKVNLPRGMEVDRAMSVTTMVGRGQGFTILPMTLILDGWMTFRSLRLVNVPFPTPIRSIVLISREDEYGDIPKLLAQKISKSIDESLQFLLARHLPEHGREIEIG